MGEVKIIDEKSIINEAKRLFNETWDLMDKKDRTREDDITMLHSAHTSCFLWRTANKPVNNARGEWQVSRVYSVLKMGELALLHGKYSLEICTENNIGDFDLAFGYEAVARAHAVLGDLTQANAYKQKALTASENISDEKQKEFTLGEIGSISVS
ncbi:hypothetical protein FACS189490_00800 [Clostridia bacterium]|nr:hypothetical protein FACS189490_00800 [Clostridia bacterium]